MTQQFEPFQKVLCRQSLDGRWRIEFFAEYDTGSDFPYRCLTRRYRYCIPYEGNEHLFGTSTNPVEPEPDFKFGDHVEVSRNRNFWTKAVYYHKSYDPTKPHCAVIESNGEAMSWEHCRKADW